MVILRLMILSMLLLTQVRGATVRARAADEFVESAAICTHLPYTDKAYFSQWPVVRQRLLDLGVRHIRDGGASSDFVGKVRDLSTNGVKTILILDPGAGVTPTQEFWTPSSASRQMLVAFLKNRGLTNAISAIEIMNEIDLFYNRGWISDYAQAGYFWKAGNTKPTNHLSNDAASPVWWGKYIVSMASNTWNVLKADPATAGIKIIGPSFGGFHDAPPTGAGSMTAFVDWGCFHPYPFGGNPFSDRAGYAGVDWYIGHGQQPSCNIDEWPRAFSTAQGAFGTKPMTATETGWFTGSADKAVSEAAQAKYVPRLYLEYFLRGIVRCSHYELLDEGTDATDNEQNRGLLRSNLSPKPAYTALKNLLGLLSDRGPAFETKALGYTLTKTMPKGYGRPQYLRSLLLQKRDGSFWLVLWHEIASSSFYTAAGQAISGVARDIEHPDVSVKLTFDTPVANATVFRPNQSADSQTNYVAPQTMTIPVNDSPVLIKLEADRPELKALLEGSPRLQLFAQTNHSYILERSEDLQTWLPVATYKPVTVPYEISSKPACPPPWLDFARAPPGTSEPQRSWSQPLPRR